MTRKRRFKVQLGFAAFVIIIVIYGWSEYDLSDKMTRNAVSRTKEISGMYERAYEYPSINRSCLTRYSIRTIVAGYSLFTVRVNEFLPRS